MKNRRLTNIYEQIYLSHHFKVDNQTTKQQAEEIIRHIGFLFNATGAAIKDLIKVVGYRFGSIEESSSKQNIEQRQDIQPLRVEIPDKNNNINTTQNIKPSSQINSQEIEKQANSKKIVEITAYQCIINEQQPQNEARLREIGNYKIGSYPIAEQMQDQNGEEKPQNQINFNMKTKEKEKEKKTRKEKEKDKQKQKQKQIQVPVYHQRTEKKDKLIQISDDSSQ